MHWWNNYVGIPYEWGGHSRSGASCWGLVCLVQQEVFGKRLPRMDELEHDLLNGEEVQASSFARLGQEVPLSEVESGDVLHMRTSIHGRVLPLHCGIVTEPGKVLHTEEYIGSSIRSYSADARFQNRVLGAYRVV